MESNTYTVAGQEFELQHHGVKGMKWGVRKKYKRGDAMDANDPSDKKTQKQTAKRGAKAIVTALQTAGTLYAIDVTLTGGAVTRTAVKTGKAAVKSAINKVGDQLFDYSVLDSAGKVIRRYN
jgi:hypothetical protein